MSVCSTYGGIQQRWLVVESEARKEADLKHLVVECRIKNAECRMQNEKALFFSTYKNSKLPFHLCPLPLETKIQQHLESAQKQLKHLLK